MKKILILFFISFSIVLNAKQYVLIHPYGNLYQTVWHKNSDSPASHPYSFAPNLWNGQAFRFATIITEDTVDIIKRYPPSPNPNPQPKLMELVGIWNLPDTQSKATNEDSFEGFVGKLIGKDFTKVKVVHPDRARDNLVPFRYKGKHCMLLWDTPTKCVQMSDADLELSWNVFDFDYSLKDAKQIALCRYSEECYVLLLLTEKSKSEKKVD